MATRTLTERIAAEIEVLKVERARIKTQADLDVIAVNAKIDVLQTAKQAMTPAVEAAYVALTKAGLIPPGMK